MASLLQSTPHPRSPGGLGVQRDVAAVPADPSGLAQSVSADALARVSEAEQVALAQLSASASARRAEVDASFAAAKQQIGQGFGAFTTQAETGENSETTQITAAGAAASATIGQQAKSTAAAAEGSVARLESKSAAAGSQEATRAKSEAAAQQLRAKPVVGGAADQEVQQGKEKIAAAVDGKAKTELTNAGDLAAASVGTGQQQLATGLYGPAKADARSKINAAAAQASQAIGSGQSTARTAARQLTSKATTEAAKAERTVTQGIAAGRALAGGDVAAWEAAGRAKISAAAEQYRAEISSQAHQLEETAHAALPTPEVLDSTRAEVEAGLHQGTDSIVVALTESAAGMDAGLAQMTGQHSAAVAASGQQARQQIAQLGQTVRSGQQQATTAFRTTTAAATSEAGAGFSAVPGQLEAQLAGPHQTGLDAMRGKVDDAGRRGLQWADQARTEGERGSGDLDSAASSLAQRASAQQQPQVQGWFEEIVGSMRRWLKDKLGNVLGGIVSGIILALPAIAIAVALIFAGPVGWGVLATLFVVGAGIGIYSRYKEYEADHGGQGPSGWTSVGVVALGIADITGIPYIVEAGSGQRAFAPQPMKEFERWERGTEGVIFFALMFAGGAKKLFGRGPVEVPTVKPEVKPEVGPGAPEVKPETKPSETPAEAAGPKATDPATVEFPAGTNNEKFQFVKKQIQAAPPGQRAQTARILFERLKAESGNSWSARENAATNGAFWTGEGAPFIFFVDSAGNVFQGKIGPNTLTSGPSGNTVNPASLAAAAPPAPAAPAPAQTPTPPAPSSPTQPATPTTPAGTGGPPPTRPGVPLPAPSDDHEGVFQ